MNLVEELCWQLKQDHLLEILGQDGPFNYNYAATQRGREHAARLMEICGYVGPAPVSLQAYTTMLKRQNESRRDITVDDVRLALGGIGSAAGGGRGGRSGSRVRTQLVSDGSGGQRQDDPRPALAQCVRW